MKKLFGAVLIPAFLAACGSGISTNTDFDPAVDFSGFQTYAWLPAGNGMEDGSGIHADQLTDGRIRSAVEANLNAKGLRKVSPDQVYSPNSLPRPQTAWHREALNRFKIDVFSR